MKKIFVLFMLVSSVVVSEAQSSIENEVSQAVETLRKAMIEGNGEKLAELTAASLTYGHSSGKIEDQAAFIAALTDGNNKILKLTFTDQSIVIVENIATVRNTMDLDIQSGEDDPRSIHLIVLMTWMKVNGEWKLLSRQAARV